MSEAVIGVVSGLGRFAISLYREVLKASADENVFLSPFSISVALAMTGVGAKGNTLQELKALLGVGCITEEDLHSGFSDITTLLKSDGGKSGYKLQSGNRLFCHKRYRFLPNFLEATKSHYDAEAVLMDFTGDAKGSRKKINQWVQKQTLNKIKDIIPPGLIGSQTRMVLANAIYFKGDWTHKFSKWKTRKEPFYITRDDVIDVNMMHLTKDLRYHSDPTLEVKIIELPYGNGDLSMYILLPEKIEGLKEVEAKLTHTALEDIIQKTRMSFARSVQVSLPRFKIEEQVRLKEVLCDLSLVDIFAEGKADLSGIDGTKELFVSDVLHKAYIDVNEEGTEAAAATAITRELECRTIPAMFKADHPFLFIIQDNRSKAILFMGRLYRPSMI